jgi:glycosyltransferase involved in cell wall biosynthesis
MLKISVAMCTYNGARFLQEQLASLVAQRRQPDELVVYDDSSTDDSVELLQHFARTSPFPVRIHSNESNLGSTANFERAISSCEGDIIALCDQDDIWSQEKLHLFEQRFTEDPGISLIFTDADIVDDEAQLLGYKLWESLRFDKQSQELIKSPDAFEILSQRQVVTGATMAFRANFKDLVLPIPQNIPLIHDGWIALMISLVGRLDPIERPLIKYRQHESQQMGAPVTGPPPSPSTILGKAQRHYNFVGELKKLEAVWERVESRKGQYDFTQEESLAQRLKHVRSRVAISQNKLSNIPAAFVELFAGRYHRYSHGFSSLVKDLVR